jgi:transcriptional regulator with XRE-family HTH domain
MTFEMIEQERKTQRIAVARLCHTAGIDPRNYARIRSGARQPRGDTLAKLSAALTELRRGARDRGTREKSGRASRSRAIFRMLLAQLAREAGIDVRAALDHVAQQKATASAEWMEISRLRDVTCYMLNTVAGWSNAEVAAAAGVTAPAITNAIRKVEDKREAHPELEAVFSMFEAAVQ